MTPESEARVRAAVADLADALIDALREAEAPHAVDADQLLSVDEAAQALGVGRSTVYQEIAGGRLRTLSIGRRRLVPASALAAYSDPGPPT